MRCSKRLLAGMWLILDAFTRLTKSTKKVKGEQEWTYVHDVDF
jgi:hypothetical protein